MTNKIKKTIQINFGKHTQSYEEYALLQKESAKRLFSFFQATKKTNLVEGPLLEVGCGTGFVSEFLLELFPQNPLIFSDLTLDMVKTCQRNLVEHPHFSGQVVFQVLDGEKVLPANTYSMIASGYTFQWFSLFGKSIHNLLQALLPGGFLLFSVPMEGCFPEWKELCFSLGISYTGNPFPALRDLQQIQGYDFSKFDTLEEDYTLSYESVWEFLKSMKKIGASTSKPQKRLNIAEVKKLKSLSSLEKSFLITYKTLYVLIPKDSQNSW